MALWDKLKFWNRLQAGRPRHLPERETDLYPRLIGLGVIPGVNAHQPLIKMQPATLRYFSRTPHARRAINAVKNPIAMLDWEIVPKDKKTKEGLLKAQCDAVTESFRNPNQDDSFRTFVEQIVEDILVAGAGAAETQVGGMPLRPLWMWPTDGMSIQIFPMWSGDKNEARYLQTLGFGNVSMIQGVQLRNDELMYIRPNPSTATPYGYGALEIAFQTISRKLGVAEYAGKLTANATPENLLAFKGYDVNALQTLRTWWRNEVEGQGQAPIVGQSEKDGIQVHKLRGSDDKALYLEYQEFLIREIAAAFDLSPQNLGLEADVNRNTSETAEDRDWDQAIKPMADLLAAHFNRDCIAGLLGFSQIEFRWKGLDREDEKATADIFAVYYENNTITPNEQREKLGMQPSKSKWADLNYADVQVEIAKDKGKSPAPASQVRN